jgi:hypothetical protein
MTATRRSTRKLIDDGKRVFETPAGQPISNVARDPPDLRDRIYIPTLQGLQPKLSPTNLLLVGDPTQRRLRILCRDQGNQPTCAGMALAAVIDILRWGSKDAVVAPSSGRMLYEFARQRDERISNGGGLTLRNVIKAFFHHGVCLQTTWPDVNEVVEGTAWAEEARGTTLGAYFRLNGMLNEFHAALNEVGAIYASAHTHRGWRAPEDNRAAPGVIAQADDAGEGHAFVIVGYTEEGFLVLNSWGEHWGRYDGYPGIAVWPYADWAENLLDAWVLRLGVATPSAFDCALRPAGMSTGDFGFGVSLASAGPPQFSIRSHYAHLDDGCFVTTGNYPSPPSSITDALADIAKWHETGDTGEAIGIRNNKVLIWCAGGTDGLNDVMAFVAKTKPFWLQRGIYPYTIVWCSDFVDNTTGVFDHLFEAAYNKLGKTGEALDQLIESSARGIGRAFWRDVEATAERTMAARQVGDAARPDGVKAPTRSRRGEAALVLDDLMRLRFHRDLDLEIHVVAEGAGALLFGHYLDNHAVFAPALASITLIAPVLQRAELKRLYEPVLEPAEPGSTVISVIRPNTEFERRTRMGLYGKSPMHLIANSFDDPVMKPSDHGDRPVATPPAYVGMAGVGQLPPGVSVVKVKTHPETPRELSFQHLTRDPDVRDWIAKKILGEATAETIVPGGKT